MTDPTPIRLRNHTTYAVTCPDCGTSVAGGSEHTFPECVAALIAEGRHMDEGWARKCRLLQDDRRKAERALAEFKSQLCDGCGI